MTDKVPVQCPHDCCDNEDVFVQLERVYGDDTTRYRIFSISETCTAGFFLSAGDAHTVTMEAREIASVWTEQEREAEALRGARS